VSSSRERWDDSGTGVGLGPGAAGAPTVLVPDESVDNVGIAMQDLAPGDVVDAGGRALHVRTAVPMGHKIAVVDIPAGSSVRKLGHTIGEATVPIEAGAHVHVHNLVVRASRARRMRYLTPTTVRRGARRSRPPATTSSATGGRTGESELGTTSESFRA